MKGLLIAGAIGIWCLPGWAQPERADNPVIPDPPMLGPHLPRGQAGGHGGGSSPQMTYHNGPVMQNSVTAAIFWGASWANSSFVGDKISGLGSWYQGEGGSNFAKTSDEYTSTTTQVGNASSYIGHFVDTTAAPTHAPRTGDVLNEVCRVLTVNNVTPVANGYYAVYVDTPRGHTGYCAWHSWSSCSNVPIQFAFFFNLDGDPGCDPQDTRGVHSQGLAALANVTGHELSEARTDPRGTGWFDSSGAENADKCAWSFGSAFVMFSNHSTWKIQGNWSNLAYTSTAGYANGSGQFGCLDGGNYGPVAQ